MNWRLKLRDDQVAFIKAAMSYLIERHTTFARSKDGAIEKFAHDRSRERAQEILDELNRVTG